MLVAKEREALLLRCTFRSLPPHLSRHGDSELSTGHLKLVPRHSRLMVPFTVALTQFLIGPHQMRLSQVWWKGHCVVLMGCGGCTKSCKLGNSHLHACMPRTSDLPNELWLTPNTALFESGMYGINTLEEETVDQTSQEY